MFQCYSLKSSHPRLLPESKVFSLYLCHFCCLAYRVIITIFLNSMYMCQYTVLVFFFLAYFTLYNQLQFGCGEKGTLLHCWCECKLAQPLWRTVYRFLKTLELELPYDPAISLLGIHTEETRKETHVPQCSPKHCLQ